MAFILAEEQQHSSAPSIVPLHTSSSLHSVLLLHLSEVLSFDNKGQATSVESLSGCPLARADVMGLGMQ